MILSSLASAYLSWSCDGGRTQSLLSGCFTLWTGWRGGALGGVAGLLVVYCYHYHRLSQRPARLVRVRWEEVSDPVRRRLAETVERIVERTESLSPEEAAAPMFIGISISLPSVQVQVMFSDTPRRERRPQSSCKTYFV